MLLLRKGRGTLRILPSLALHRKDNALIRSRLISLLPPSRGYRTRNSSFTGTSQSATSWADIIERVSVRVVQWNELYRLPFT